MHVWSTQQVHITLLTLPVGLCGVLTRMNFVLLLNAASSCCRGMSQLGGCSCTGTNLAPTCGRTPYDTTHAVIYITCR
jgi:hypothetical protein